MRRRLFDSLSRRLHAEEGWAMVVAVMVTALMVSLGLATAVVVDSQTQGAARERLHGADLHLAPGALASHMGTLPPQGAGGPVSPDPSPGPAAGGSAQCS